MSKQLWSVGMRDVFKGAVTAILAAILTVLYGVFNQAGFDVFEADWGVILSDVINVALTAFLAYLGKNFISDADDKILGSI